MAKNQKQEEGLNIVYVKIKDLHLAEYNPKKFDSKQFKNLGKSVKVYGWLSPLIVNKRTGNVIDGNQRLKNEIKKGDLEVQVPVVYLDVDEETEKKMNRALDETRTGHDQELSVQLLKSLTSQDEFIEALLENYKERIDEATQQFEPEMSIAVDADEQYDYLMFIADKSIDFLTVCNFFGVDNVYDMNRKKMIGLGRVVKMSDLIKLIDFARNKGAINVKQV